MTSCITFIFSFLAEMGFHKYELIRSDQWKQQAHTFIHLYIQRCYGTGTEFFLYKLSQKILPAHSIIIHNDSLKICG